MKQLKLRIKIFAGLLLTQFNAQASSGFEINLDEYKSNERNLMDYFEPDQSDYLTGSENEKTKDLFTSGCDRLMQLEDKVNLNLVEIEEGILLDGMIGDACDNPKEYKMSSIAHKIKEL